MLRSSHVVVVGPLLRVDAAGVVLFAPNYVKMETALATALLLQPA